MSSIKRAFAAPTVLVPFVTCGDPDLETTKEVVKALAKNGAGIVELGIPFSDPTGEGPLGQEANVRALANGTTTNKIFEMVSELRKEVRIPMVFKSYATVVFAYGTEAFLKKCQEIGIDGLALLDVPYEEREEFSQLCHQYGIDFIFTVAPTSGKRISFIAKEAEGYLYCIGALGPVSSDALKANVTKMVQLAKEANPNLPCIVGLGEVTAELINELKGLCDGFAIAEDIVRITARDGKNAPQAAAEYMRGLKA